MYHGDNVGASCWGVVLLGHVGAWGMEYGSQPVECWSWFGEDDVARARAMEFRRNFHYLSFSRDFDPSLFNWSSSI